MVILRELDDRQSELLWVAVEATMAAWNRRVGEFGDIPRQPGIPSLPVLPVEGYVLDPIDDDLGTLWIWGSE